MYIYSDQNPDPGIEIEKEEATCAPDLAQIPDHRNQEADPEIIKRGQEDPDHKY
jgi:hypothetical protein